MTHNKVQYIEAGENADGQRLDNFLITRLKGVPKTHIYRIIRKGEVRVNGSRSKSGTRVMKGDRVRVPPIRVSTAPPPARNSGLPDLLEKSVLFKDAHLVVLNKPSGVAVHGGSGLSGGIIEALKSSGQFGDFLELAHRLDLETSGCLVLARSRKALLELNTSFSGERSTQKIYQALCLGGLESGERRIDVPLKRIKGQAGRPKTIVDADGKRAVSMVRLIKGYESASYVQVNLLTGRTHQARVHLAHIGHPILGDRIYGDFSANREYKARGLNRLFLHASELRFCHPVTRREMRVNAPLPAELAGVLSGLDDETGHARQ